jgi:hypothetical protein
VTTSPRLDVTTKAPPAKSALTLSDTVSGPWVQQGRIPCVVITGQGPTALSADVYGSVAGTDYNVTINIRNVTLPQPFAMVKDSGAGNWLEMSTSDGLTIWESVGGTMTWNPTGKSATLDIRLGSGGTDAAPRKPVRFAGSFTCSE